MAELNRLSEKKNKLLLENRVARVNETITLNHFQLRVAL